MSATREYGFSVDHGVNWSDYIQFRPIYPVSFFDKIFAYHSAKPDIQWSLAHDVGAGAGIVSGSLSARFSHIVVSDPNDGYVRIARKALISEARLPESTFTFLQESAEKSSISPGSVDLITACECMHWTDTKVALQEFHRQLKVGGTLVMTFYGRPRLPDNHVAEEIFGKIMYNLGLRGAGDLYHRAYRMSNSGLADMEVPEGHWGAIKREYTNTNGNPDAFNLNSTAIESTHRPAEEITFVENDQDWHDRHGIDWFKGYFETWAPRIPVSELQDLWDGFEAALKGEKARVEAPLVMIFATKKEIG